MKLQLPHNRPTSIITTLLALAAIAAISACSPKPSAEESAAQNKAIAEQAVVEAKKEILAEQAAEKAKQDAIIAAQAEEKAKQEAAAEKERHNKSAEHSTQAKHASCSNCGTVVSVNEIETAGKGSGAGVVAGGLIGGLLGHQVGNGTGKDLATLAGVVGGAIAGNKIESNAKKTKSYDITVKLESGEQRTVHQASAPNVAPGDKVKIENDMIVRR